MEAPPLVSPPASIAGSDKVLSVLCHLSSLFGFPILFPLVVYLVLRNESEYGKENAKEALNFHISLLIYSLVCIPLVFILIGIPLLMIMGIASFILSIIAAIKASDGGCYRYPLTIRLV